MHIPLYDNVSESCKIFLIYCPLSCNIVERWKEEPLTAIALGNIASFFISRNAGWAISPAFGAVGKRLIFFRNTFSGIVIHEWNYSPCASPLCCVCNAGVSYTNELSINARKDDCYHYHYLMSTSLRANLISLLIFPSFCPDCISTSCVINSYQITAIYVIVALADYFVGELICWECLQYTYVFFFLFFLKLSPPAWVILTRNPASPHNEKQTGPSLYIRKVN